MLLGPIEYINKYDLIITNPPFGLKNINYNKDIINKETIPYETNDAVMILL